MIMVIMIATVLKFQNKDLIAWRVKTFKVKVTAFICYLLENSCFLELFPVLGACFSWIKGQKVKGQGHLKVRFDFNSNVIKILYGCFGGTIDTLCVTIGKIFIIYCDEADDWSRRWAKEM